MTYIKLILLFSGFSIFTAVHTQDIFGRSKKDLIEYRTYRMGGWMFAPGLTYTPARVPKNETREIDPNGILAVYAEVGRFQIFYEGGNFFNYFDYSLAYKRLSGAEKYNDLKSVFKQNFVLANFNLNNIIQLSDYTFLQNSLGVNLDYKFSEKYDNSNLSGNENTNNLLFSLHYKFGYGIKAKNNLFIIPSIEVPILNALEWENGKSTYGIFSSRYRPLIFSVRFAFLRERGKVDCPDNGLSPEDKKKQEMHMMGQ
jgi:hypothetical protein